MLGHSPYSQQFPIQSLDFDLHLEIDGCPFTFHPERTARKTTIRWECGVCGESEILPAHEGFTAESLFIYGRDKADRHMMRSHPGPSTRAFIEGI